MDLIRFKRGMLGAMGAAGLNYPFASASRFGRRAAMYRGRAVLGAKLGVDHRPPFTSRSRLRRG